MNVDNQAFSQKSRGNVAHSTKLKFPDCSVHDIITLTNEGRPLRSEHRIAPSTKIVHKEQMNFLCPARKLDKA